nr:OTU domain-containing protein At3g57810 [Ipomoea batatas]GMC99677.1 OTU domain-containing protein At3g57810 [Ipomoea batatas]
MAATRLSNGISQSVNPCHFRQNHIVCGLLSLLSYHSAVEILEQLRQGVAEFELVSSPFSSTPTSNLRTLQHKALPFGFLTETRTSTHNFFARIGPSL